jgi:hypothetical protein
MVGQIYVLMMTKEVKEKTDIKDTEESRKKNSFLESTRKYLTIASGATTIGSAERTPDDIAIQLRSDESK